MTGERRAMQEALFYGFSLERHVPDNPSSQREGARTVIARGSTMTPEPSDFDILESLFPRRKTGGKSDRQTADYAASSLPATRRR